MMHSSIMGGLFNEILRNLRGDHYTNVMILKALLIKKKRVGNLIIDTKTWNIYSTEWFIDIS